MSVYVGDLTLLSGDFIWSNLFCLWCRGCSPYALCGEFSFLAMSTCWINHVGWLLTSVSTRQSCLPRMAVSRLFLRVPKLRATEDGHDGGGLPSPHKFWVKLSRRSAAESKKIINVCFGLVGTWVGFFCCFFCYGRIIILSKVCKCCVCFSLFCCCSVFFVHCVCACVRLLTIFGCFSFVWCSCGHVDIVRYSLFPSFSSRFCIVQLSFGVLCLSSSRCIVFPFPRTAFPQGSKDRSCHVYATRQKLPWTMGNLCK